MSGLKWYCREQNEKKGVLARLKAYISACTNM